MVSRYLGRSRVLAAMVVSGLLGAGIGGCGKGGGAEVLPVVSPNGTAPDAAAVPPAPEVPHPVVAEPPPKPTVAANAPMVVFETTAGAVPVIVEIAATEDQRRTGLMHRRYLEPGRGMLFLMPEERVQVFWMKNTFIPLDMIFIDASLEVVGVVENTTPLTETPRGVNRPSLYVVEIPGGTARPAGITPGIRVRGEGIPELKATR